LKEQSNYLKNSTEIIKLALKEDIGPGDVTTESIVPLNTMAKAGLIAKDTGIVCGLKVAQKVFEFIGGNLKWKFYFEDGNFVNKGDLLAVFEGNARTLLKGERTALNFLQRLSGIATKTRKFVEEIKGTETKLLDSRKTVPGLRLLDKYAVRVGGGNNHRFGLFDMILIKENHIRIAGSVSKAIRSVKKLYGGRFKIEVEVNNINEIKEALKEKPDIIMLDNMSLNDIEKAVKIINGNVLTEASGNVTLENIRKIAEAGVDFISVGELTHSVKAMDISMLFY